MPSASALSIPALNDGAFRANLVKVKVHAVDAPFVDEGFRLFDEKDMSIAIPLLLVALGCAFSIAHPAFGGVAIGVVTSLIVAGFVTHLGALMSAHGRYVMYSGVLVLIALALI
ncbi:MAG: hypothetical protein Q8O64_14570 [Sideroxyarcus sp.]|nr:hypothetical protein [Sideroxyarcus sp.]